MIVIDAFTRKVYLEAMKDKKASTTLIAFKRIINKLPSPPKYITSDLGSEFNNSILKRYLESKNIAWYTTHGHSPLVERYANKI